MAPGILLDPLRIGREAGVFERKLRERVIGQDEAVREIVGVYQTFLAGLAAPGRPVGSFLFLGPTGSGKTRSVEAVAEALAGDSRAVIKVDCAEYQHGHEIAKLVGSPPGYLGHRETHPLLSQEALNQYQTENVKLSFVLFDEVEKASDALWNLLLGILDKAVLTLGDNRRVDFSRALIFLTSNLGAREIETVVRPKLGFSPVQAAADGNGTEKISQAGVDAVRRKFSPEFVNRLDKIVVFQPLGQQELRSVLRLELEAIRERIANAAGTKSIKFDVSEGGQDLLLEEGTDERYGARHLKRTVERLVVQPLANLMATGQIQPGDWVRVERERGEHRDRLLFFKKMREPAGKLEKTEIAAPQTAAA